MSNSLVSVEQSRQISSKSGVLGKKLEDNLFVVILEYTEGLRVGILYRVAPGNETGTLRRIEVRRMNCFTNGALLKKAPLYRVQDLGDNFWNEEF